MESCYAVSGVFLHFVAGIDPRSLTFSNVKSQGDCSLNE